MTIESSKNFLVKVGGTSSPYTFTNLGTQSDGRLGMNAQRIPTSNKTTSGWNTSLGGLRDFVVTVSGFCDWPDTNGLAAVMTNAIAGNNFGCQVTFNLAPKTAVATVQATGLEIDGANNDATKYNITMELAQGAPVISG